MAESYDFFDCAVCKKVKPAGGEVVRKIAFPRYNLQAQDNKKKQARYATYYALVCNACETEKKCDEKESELFQNVEEKKT